MITFLNKRMVGNADEDGVVVYVSAYPCQRFIFITVTGICIPVIRQMVSKAKAAAILSVKVHASNAFRLFSKFVIGCRIYEKVLIERMFLSDFKRRQQCFRAVGKRVLRA